MLFRSRTNIKDKILTAVMWSRLYGGAAAVIMIDGHQDQLAEPLDLESILPNSFKGLLVLDRWSGIYPNPQLIEDISHSEFGLPESYNITDSVGQIGTTVHHSRIIRFPGRKLPFWEEQAEMYWGASEIEHIFEELKKRDNTSQNIASLVFKANVLFYKIDGMSQMMASADPQTQADLYNVVSAMTQMMNNNSMQIVDQKDDFFTNQYTFSGINEIYESFMLDVAGASEIPVTRLFGRAPAGLNATGEGDEVNYNSMLKQLQETYLRPVFDKLLPIMFVSEFGDVPDDLDYTFNSINTPSDKDLAELVNQKVTAISTVFGDGIINKTMALKELKTLSDSTNMFTNITDEDIAKAEQDELIDSLLPPMTEQPSINDFQNDGKSRGATDSLGFKIPSATNTSVVDGGDGSGNHGHAGIKGEQGGSAPQGENNGDSEINIAEARKQIINGTYPSKVCLGKQRKHIQGTKEFEQARIHMQREFPGSEPAILTTNAKELIDKYKGTGNVYLPKGSDYPKEIITCEQNVGKTWYKSANKYIDTNTFMVVYSSKGTHIIPINNYRRR